MSFKIECKDIIVREFVESDLDEFHALTWQPSIYVFLPGWNVSKEQRKEWLLNYEIPDNKRFLDAVSKGGDIGELRLRMGIILKENNKFIGWCCTGIKEELPPPNREIMYAVSPDFRGKGYASQAVIGLVKYLFQNTNTEMLKAVALLENIPSNRVLQKSGFRFESIIGIDGEFYNSYSLARE